MSSPLYLTYKEMAAQVAWSLGLVPEASTDEVLWTDADQKRIAVFLTNAARWALAPANNAVIWPDLVLTKTLTLTNGTFDLSDVDYSTRFALWSSDPRPYGAVTYPITVTQSGTKFYPAAPQNGIFCLYLPQPPQFTTTAYDGAKAYVINDVVYDAATGQCYRALAASTGIAVTDAAKWQPQTTPAALAQAIQAKAQAFWQDMKNQIDLAQDSHGDALTFRDQAWQQVAHLAPTLEIQRWFRHGLWY